MHKTDLCDDFILTRTTFMGNDYAILAGDISHNPEMVRVYDCEGDLVITLPVAHKEPTFYGEQEYNVSFIERLVYTVLLGQTRAYELGRNVGMDRKAREIRRALGISGDPEL